MSLHILVHLLQQHLNPVVNFGLQAEELEELHIKLALVLQL